MRKGPENKFESLSKYTSKRPEIMRVLALAGAAAVAACGSDKIDPQQTEIEYGVPVTEAGPSGNSTPEKMSCREVCAFEFSAEQGDRPGKWGCWEAWVDGQPVDIDQPVDLSEGYNTETLGRRNAVTGTVARVRYICAKTEGHPLTRVGPGTGAAACAEFGLDCDHTVDEQTGAPASCNFNFDGPEQEPDGRGEEFTALCDTSDEDM